jgi:hypothetical protein
LDLHNLLGKYKIYKKDGAMILEYHYSRLGKISSIKQSKKLGENNFLRNTGSVSCRRAEMAVGLPTI